MPIEIKKVNDIGFCFGVRRAISILEKVAREKGKVDTLGALVHNEKVIAELNSRGIDVVDNESEIKSSTVAISAHGVSPQVEAILKEKKVDIIDTTCPDVRRAQKTAQKLAAEGYFVVVYGEASHPEVKGIMGWADEKGLATLDIKGLAVPVTKLRQIGVISQTTQIPENFSTFVKELIDRYLAEGVEIRIINTICHGVRRRQSETFDLAKNVDLMLVIGSRTSANSQRLVELCSGVTETHLILDASDIDPQWLKDKEKVGVTSGTSTSEKSIEEVMLKLESLTKDIRL
jgi:4-hydroxy-3-methylbut-2-en-1-yl diphosphate reductase